MARIGLTNFRYAILTENATTGVATYGGAKTPGHAISCSVEITNNDASLYGDDTLIESDKTFQSGTVTMGIDKDDVATMSDLLGHEYDNETGVMTRKVDDTAPYVALGRVITKMVGGEYKYTVEILYKVKFAEPSQEDTTKGESIEFGTTEIEGTVSALKSGLWSEQKTFTSKADAIQFIETAFSSASSY